MEDTITIVIAVPLLGATAYAPYHYFTKTKTLIQSVGNSVYILKRKDLLKRACFKGSEFVTDYVQKNFEEAV